MQEKGCRKAHVHTYQPLDIFEFKLDLLLAKCSQGKLHFFAAHQLLLQLALALYL